jgi:hypothetical protein
MSDSEIQVKKGRTKKNGEPDLRSSSSAVNVSKARSKVKACLKAGKQIIDNSDSEESGDEIIDLVIRKKDAKLEPEPDVIRRTPLKNVLKGKKKRFDQPDSSGSDEDAEPEPPTPRISKTKAKLKDMEKKHKDLEDQFETMKRDINERANKKVNTESIDEMRKKILLRF